LPFLATDLGLWWGTDSELKAGADIDIVADNKLENKILLGECKWRNEHTGIADIQGLVSSSRLMPGYEDYRYMFFSKAPFSEEARRLAKSRDDLELVTLEMLFQN